ncbi:MAG: response regulator [Acidobacteria bacterium]|nr:response regulator [Acidobacteriota bacterium]
MANRPHISVVDDDNSVRKSLQGLIRSVGFAVNVFVSAEEFLKSEHLHSTDCLILDMRMPGMNGLELQRQLVAGNRKIPVIFIKALGDESVRFQTLKAGAVDYLLKPFSEEALLKAINAALSSKGVERKTVETLIKG